MIGWFARPRRAFSISMAAVVLTPALAMAEPVRLDLVPERTTVAVRDRTTITLQFLDRNFAPTANDRDRVIKLDARRTDGSGGGVGEISPSSFVAPAGTRSFSSIRFTGTAEGRVILRARSDGLARAEALVTVVSRQSSLLGNFLFPTARAQRDPSFGLEPSVQDPIPLNQTSTANFWIALDEAAPEPLTWKIETTPSVVVRYRGEETRGFAHVRIEKGAYSAEFQLLQPSRSCRVKVRARAIPEGREQEAEVAFVPAVPERISFRNEPYSAGPHERIVPIEIALVDPGDRYLEVLGSWYEIVLDLPRGSTGLPRTRLRLGPGSPSGHAEVHLPRFRLGSELELLARDSKALLGTGQTSVEVAAASLALLLLASGGGFLGGLVRHVYHIRSPHLWPTTVGGQLEPGLVINGLFSVLFGTVLFLSTHHGIFHLWNPAFLSGVAAQEAPPFVLGVVGGFAGVLVLERWTQRLLHATAPPDALELS